MSSAFSDAGGDAFYELCFFGGIDVEGENFVSMRISRFCFLKFFGEFDFQRCLFAFGIGYRGCRENYRSDAVVENAFVGLLYGFAFCGVCRPGFDGSPAEGNPAQLNVLSGIS